MNVLELEQYKMQVARMREDAMRVANMFIERMQAYADERAASAELLRWVMREIAPALPVLVGEVKPYQERGIGLIGAWSRNADGDYWCGDRLVLFELGPSPASFAKISYSGPSNAAPVTTRIWLSTDEVVQQWSAVRVLKQLQVRLTEERDGNAVERRDEAIARTRKLRAVLELVT